MSEESILADGARATAPAAGPYTLAVVAPCPFPVNHGTPGSIREIVQKQARRGHRVHVVTYPLSDRVPLDPEVTLHRVSLAGRSRRIRVGPTWMRPLWDALAVALLAKVVRRERAQLIHVYNYEGALIGWPASRLLGVPLVFTTFNTMEDELPSYDFIRPRALAAGFARALDRWVPHLADRIIAISDELIDFLGERGVRRERMDLVPMGIDPAAIEGGDGRRVREDYGLGDRPLVVYAGLLNAFQRTDILIRAFASVAREVEDARLLLVANYLEPDDPARLEEEALEHGVEDKVILTDERPFEDVPDFLAAADVCVVSRPNCPGVPIKMLNYLAAGKPVVTPVGSSKGLRDESEALLARDGDSEDLARQMVRLLGDPGLRERIGRQGRVALEERFSLDAICGQIEETYARALAGPPTPP